MTEHTNESIHGNLTRAETWRRLFFVLAFGFVYWVVHALVWALALAQAGFALLTGRPNAALQTFSGELAAYIAQIVAYMTWAEDGRPFPFAPWPPADRRGADVHPDDGAHPA
jgi:hypothetical protein